MEYTILIVDDNAMMQAFLSNYFRKEFKVVGFQHAQHAMKWLNEGNIPDIILADLKMPDISGLEFLEQLKRSGMFRDIPVIMVSGVDKSNDRIKCLEMGAVDYIIKPFNPKELELRIKRYLKESGNIASNSLYM